MRNINGLKTNSDFQRVYGKRKSFANKYLIAYAAKNNLKETRLGISVSKKVGNSIVRHRLCRLIRESYRLHKDELTGGFDLVIVARPMAKGIGYADMESAYLHLCKKHGIILESVTDSAENGSERS